MPCGPARESFLPAAFSARIAAALPPEATEHAFRRPHSDRLVLPTDAPHVPDGFREFSMNDRSLDANATWEDTCLGLTRSFTADADAVLCASCHDVACDFCPHEQGWHMCNRDWACEDERGDSLEPASRWKAGTLHSGSMDFRSTLWSLTFLCKSCKQNFAPK